jgi:FtsZ-binding cell division protein ZapB
MLRHVIAQTKSTTLPQRFVIMTPFPSPQPWDAADPLPVMRREMKLLLIELNVLRVEVEQLRAMKKDTCNTEEFLSASINQLKQNRDQWQREAERLRLLIDPTPEQMGRLYRVFSHPGMRLTLALALGLSALSYCP